MIYLLAFLLLIIFVLSLFIFKKDIFSPTCALSLIYLFCVVLSFNNYEVWDLQSYSINTVSLIISCIAVFAIIGIITRSFATTLYNSQGVTRVNNFSYKSPKTIIEPNLVYLLLSIAFGALTVVLCVYYVFKFGGSGTWSVILSNYKIASYEGLVAIPSYLDLFSKVLTILCYLYLYVFINNVIETKKIAKNIKYLIPVLLHILRSLFMGNRYNFICVVIAFLYCFYMLYQNKHNWDKPLKLKFIIFGVISVIIVYLFFVLFKRAAGRTDSMDPIYYITMYTSGSIKLLDEYLKNPIESSAIFGKETFSGLNSFLALRGIGTYYNINLEFRYINNQNLGNVYGAIRRYYHDFGISGCLVLVGFASLVWHSFYYRLTVRKPTRFNDFLFILFMYMINALIIFPIDDKFYTIFATPTFVEMVLITFVLWFLIIQNSKKRYYRNCDFCIMHKN